MSEAQILDYSNSQIIAINTGMAKIQNGNFKLIHVIELDKYEKLITELRPILKNHFTENQLLFPYLNHELLHIQDLLNNLKPHKIRRSLDFIGSAWKWIAGNPDHEDFEIIKDKINNVLENNNKQVIINQLHNDRINNITTITNDIINAIKKDNSLTDQLALNIQFKLKLIKEELVNIGYAIHWAKSGIVNSIMLSKSEIKLATDTLDKENLPYATPEEALDFADVKIITNSSCLFYIISIPLTTKEIYEKLLIKPIKRNNVANEIKYNVILKNNEDTFGIIKNCKTINNLSICNKNSIVNISNSTCIPNLLKSLESTCDKINNHHIPNIEEVSEGILLLNQFNGIINIENISYNLNGTFLIKFHNVTIIINGTSFISREVSTFRALPAILQPTPREKDYRELLSLQMLKEAQINNINQIGLLQTEKLIHQSINYGLAVVVASILIIMIIGKIRSNKRKITIIQKDEASTRREEKQVPSTTSGHQQQDELEEAPKVLSVCQDIKAPKILFNFPKPTNEDI